VCGIAGWVDWDRDLSNERPTAKAIADVLACRGPDAEGFWLSPRAAFAHRRLAVIDIEGGKQPMIRARGGERPSVLTYSGEIYNFQELRGELEGRGVVFDTRSDTEVLLRAYMEWGPAVVTRLNGMFAFAIWDGPKERLFLARDRLGIKPLFYAIRGRSLIFGSELKALLAHPEVASEVDDEGLAEVLVMGPLRTPGRGVYRGVSELRPGFTLLFDDKGARVARYWQLESRPHTDDLDTTTNKVRSLLEDTVRRQLISDVPICTLLSGGLDSSAITALAARFLREGGRGPVDTYSIDFRDSAEHFQPSDIQPGLDAPWVRRVVEEVSARHRDVMIDTPELVENFFAPLLAKDLPSFGDIDVSLYLLCREIKKRHTVAVSGESADEVFGGYPWFHDDAAIHEETFPWPRIGVARFLTPELTARLRPEEYADARYREALAEVPLLPGEAPRDQRMREILYLNQTRFLLMLLDRKDRMSMAVGLEVRVPFCDHRLVEYAWNIPWAMKAYDGREKGILRRALEGVLPKDVLWRKKSGYPSMQNPTYAASIRALLDAVLADPRSPIRPLIDVAKVQAELDGPGPEGLAALGPLGVSHLWAYLVQVNAWLERYRVRIR
jgi:asparagine synthase (glutamine-hydrolysing)